MLALCLMTPVIELSQSHLTRCNKNDCLICLVAGALGVVQYLTVVTILSTAFLIHSGRVCTAWRDHFNLCEYYTPIALKTKINS